MKMRQDLLDAHTRNVMYINPQGEPEAPPVYTIPVVVHVVHKVGVPIGGAGSDNPHDSIIAAGISDMNYAFRNQGPFNIGLGHDCEIEFCLAVQDTNGNATNGIIRVANNTYATLDSDTEDSDLKSSAGSKQWDPTSYLNIWLVREIYGSNPTVDSGTAGYAYFPSSHGQPWDGIVNEARFFGDNFTDTKVCIHEAGHYLNLAHTWSGGCTNGDCTTDGDQVCDTPPDNSTASPGGSCTSQNSCATDATSGPFSSDTTDMIENYMDYSSQTCQDKFTSDQGDRMRTALSGTRASLLSSLGCVNPSTPNIYFSTPTMSVSESDTANGGFCMGYREVTVTMNISTAPTGAATCTFSYGGTASAGADYAQGTGPEITFPNGSSASQTVTIPIYNDASIEGTETISITYTLGGSSNAVAGSFNQTLVISITDDDVLPATAGTLYLLDEDFSSGSLPTGWANNLFFGGVCCSPWTFSNNATMTNSAHISTSPGGSDTYDYNNTTKYWGIASPSLDATGISGDIIFRGDVNVDGDATDDYGRIMVNESGWTYLNDPDYTPLNNMSGEHTFTFWSGFGLQGSTFQLGLIWRNDNATITGDPIEWDNVQVYTEDQQAQVEDALTTVSIPFGPFDTAYVYNGKENDLVAQVINLSNHDYGCTTFQIDRAGTGATQFQNSAPASYVMDKTLLVTPTTNNASGQYKIRLYFTQAETDGWEAATSNNKTSLELFKSSQAISNASGTNVFGTSQSNGAYNTNDYWVEATFNTGFSGFGAAVSSPSPLPASVLSFNGTPVDDKVILKWNSIETSTLDMYVLERSLDGTDFNEIEMIQPTGETGKSADYSHADDITALLGNPYLYYRLKMLDHNGGHSYSNTIAVKLSDPHLIDFVTVYPNPFDKQITVQAYSPQQGTAEFVMTDMSGKQVYSKSVDVKQGVNNVVVNPGEKLPVGVYFVRYNALGQTATAKVLKTN